jgi:hypothetical protein
MASRVGLNRKMNTQHGSRNSISHPTYSSQHLRTRQWSSWCRILLKIQLLVEGQVRYQVLEELERRVANVLQLEDARAHEE